MRDVIYLTINPILISEAYSKRCQICKMDCFAKKFNGSKALTIFLKRFILDVWQGQASESKYSYISKCLENCLKILQYKANFPLKFEGLNNFNVPIVALFLFLKSSKFFWFSSHHATLWQNFINRHIEKNQSQK